MGDVATWVASIGGLAFGAAGLVVGCIGIGQARRANSRATDANLHAKDANRIAKDANRIANEAVTKADEANELTRIASEQANEDWLVQWSAVYSPATRSLTFENIGRDTAYGVSIHVTSDEIRITTDRAEEVPRGGVIEVDVPEVERARAAADRERRRIFGSAVIQVRHDFTYYANSVVTWKTRLGRTDSQEDALVLH